MTPIDDPQAGHEAATTTPALQRSRRAAKTTTGCIGCRLRRKKCSLERPHCANCVRNGILCTWVEPGNEQHARLLRRTNPRAAAAAATSSPATASPHRSHHDDHRGSRPFDPIAAVAELISASIPHPGAGCGALLGGILGLASNSVLRRPSSQVLFEHYLHRTNKAIAVCRSRGGGGGGAGAGKVASPPGESSSGSSGRGRTRTGSDSGAETHGSSNPFVAELIPVALTHPVVLDAVLACSGIHLAGNRGGDGDGARVAEATWIHYGQAIQGQKFALTQLARGETAMLAPLLVTAMILIIAESFKQDSGPLALYHLKAVRALMRENGMRLPALLSSPQLAGFLVQRYTYTMTLAHITMGSESDAWVLGDSALMFRTLRGGAEVNDDASTAAAAFGCVHELFEYIPRVAVWARRFRALLDSHGGDAGSDMGVENAMIWDEYATLHYAVSSWQPRSDCDDDEIYSLCGQVYQQALLVYLAASSQCGGGPAMLESQYPAAVHDAFEAFLSLIEFLPVESPISTSLCWPLAIFGSCARTPDHQAFIRRRLALLAAAYRSSSVRDAGELLEKLWCRGRDGGLAFDHSPLEFENLMKEEGKVVLFF